MSYIYSHGWEHKQNVINEFLLSLQRVEIMTRATTAITLKDIVVSKINQSLNSKHYVVLSTRGI